MTLEHTNRTTDWTQSPLTSLSCTKSLTWLRILTFFLFHHWILQFKSSSAIFYIGTFSLANSSRGWYLAAVFINCWEGVRFFDFFGKIFQCFLSSATTVTTYSVIRIWVILHDDIKYKDVYEYLLSWNYGSNSLFKLKITWRHSEFGDTDVR